MTQAEVSDLVDEFGELERRLVEFRPAVARRDEVRKRLEAECRTQPEDQPVRLEGRVYDVVAGARSIRRIIPNMAALFSRIGKSVFLEYCTFPLTHLDRIPNLNLDEVLVQKRDGPRTMTPVLRAVAKPPRAQAITKKRGAESAKARDEARA